MIVSKDRCRARAAKLLPWYANGTLTAAESADVAHHLRACACCREELARLRSLAVTVCDAPAPDFDIEAGLTKVWGQLAPPSEPRRRWPLADLGLPSWGTNVAGVAATAALALLLLAAPPSSPRWSSADGRYGTLTSEPEGARARAVIVVAFATDAPAAAREALLRHWDLLVISGPDEVGFFEVRPAAASPAAGDPLALARLAEELQRAPAVRFAQALP